MPIFHAALDWRRPGNRVTLRFRVHPRIAREALPLIEKLLADTRDGETYRFAIGFWRHAERPPLTVYQGDSSTCRIDGPLQAARPYFPLGGLIELYDLPCLDLPFDRRTADREALVLIAHWVARHRREGAEHA
ncbi:hypothetical protein LWC05_13415 [Acetobacter sicerae]|uniref:Uncharacterized protein n=1 Tax=Acetobacter sicerae TaxID=85325 RepID=A0ABS8VV55_9PROT|nr:hypothetical protein [Acetobacter sicerae]MCE0744878.1 hypothetical protein [Acetobacter sicerae]